MEGGGVVIVLLRNNLYLRRIKYYIHMPTGTETEKVKLAKKFLRGGGKHYMELNFC